MVYRYKKKKRSLQNVAEFSFLAGWYGLGRYNRKRPPGQPTYSLVEIKLPILGSRLTFCIPHSCSVADQAGCKLDGWRLWWIGVRGWTSRNSKGSRQWRWEALCPCFSNYFKKTHQALVSYLRPPWDNSSSSCLYFRNQTLWKVDLCRMSDSSKTRQIIFPL